MLSAGPPGSAESALASAGSSDPRRCSRGKDASFSRSKEMPTETSILIQKEYLSTVGGGGRGWKDGKVENNLAIGSEF